MGERKCRPRDVLVLVAAVLVSFAVAFLLGPSGPLAAPEEPQKPFTLVNATVEYGGVEYGVAVIVWGNVSVDVECVEAATLQALAEADAEGDTLTVAELARAIDEACFHGEGLVVYATLQPHSMPGPEDVIID